LAVEHRRETFDDIIDAACDAWRNLTANPEVTTIGMRRWACVAVGKSLRPLVLRLVYEALSVKTRRCAGRQMPFLFVL
jgi:hypothetical protein